MACRIVCDRGLTLLASLLLQVGGVEGSEPTEYRPATIEKGVFSGGNLAMLEHEKSGIANQLSTHVINELAPRVEKRDRIATRLAERMIGLALNLDPQNRIATAANVELGRGIAPATIDAEYSVEVRSQLLVTRAGLLREAEDVSSRVLAGFLLEIAVEINPRNEDAVYQFEMFKLDIGHPDWGILIRRDGQD